MQSNYVLGICCLLLPLDLLAQPTYCPGNHGLIDTGMTFDQVIAACGTPTAKQESDKPIMQQIPVTQFVYSTLNATSVYPGLNPVMNMWSLPNRGSTGINFQINLVNNKVTSMSMNGGNVNAASICGGKNIQEGTDVADVVSACGNPQVVNNTFINQAIPSVKKPVIWTYQANQYTPTMSLTFIDGKLQSIN